jgi:hypothetical protein
MRPIPWSFDDGTQEVPYGFPICRMDDRVGKRDFAKDFYIVPGHRGALSAIVSCSIFGPQVVAFLMEVKVNGNTTHVGTAMLTMIVKQWAYEQECLKDSRGTEKPETLSSMCHRRHFSDSSSSEISSTRLRSKPNAKMACS